MTAIFTVAFFVMLIGVVIYLFTDPAKYPLRGSRIIDVGRIMFIIGLFVMLFCGCWGDKAVAGFFVK